MVVTVGVNVALKVLVVRWYYIGDCRQGWHSQGLRDNDDGPRLGHQVFHLPWFRKCHAENHALVAVAVAAALVARRRW